MEPASNTPLLHRKLAQIVAAEDLFEGSHDHKLAVELFESFPKDELFAADRGAARAGRGPARPPGAGERAAVRARRPRTERSVSLSSRDAARSLQRRAAPRARRPVPGAVRRRLDRLPPALGESDLARIHFTVHVGHGEVPDVSLRELEQEVAALARTWDDRLQERLMALHGEARGRALAEQ